MARDQCATPGRYGSTESSAVEGRGRRQRRRMVDGHEICARRIYRIYVDVDDDGGVLPYLVRKGTRPLTIRGRDADGVVDGSAGSVRWHRSCLRGARIAGLAGIIRDIKGKFRTRIATLA